jgi:hypothetical protein
MPDTPAKGKGKGVGKKLGGLPVWGWAAVGVGGFLVYRWWSNRQAANAALGTTSGPPATSTSGGGTTGSSGSVAAAPPGTLAQWIATALDTGTLTKGYSQLQAYNDLANFASGGCVSSTGAGFVAQTIASIGAVPGVYPSPITICPSSPGHGAPAPSATPTARPPTTPATSSALQAQLAALVGQLSSQTGRNAPQALVAQWWQQAKAKGLTGTQAEFYAETQNVGYISRTLHTPTSAQAFARARQIVGASNWTRLSPLQQNQYAEIANVELLRQLN